MKYRIELTEDAKADLNWFRVHERRIILDGIKANLSYEPLIETRHRKPLEENPLGSWELCVQKYRVFYDVERGDMVKIGVIGHKEHNTLYVRGQEVEI